MNLSSEAKDRLIELLAEVFDEASDSEGIYFTSNENAIEILRFLQNVYPDSFVDRQNQIDFLTKELNERR